MKSLWMDETEIQDFPMLMQDITVDVAIVGGGMAGINLSSKHFLPRIVLATLKYWNNEFFPTKSKSFITPVTLST